MMEPASLENPPTNRAHSIAVRAGVWLALAGLTAAIYVPTAGYGFVGYDDDRYIAENLHVQAPLSWDSLRWAFTTEYLRNWHPLTWIAHMLAFQAFGLNPGPHHLFNVALHLLNTLLLFEILQRTTGATWRGMLVAALFAVHPLHVESVAWISERKDVLSACFGLLSVLAYLAYVRKGGVARYFLMTVLFAASLMTKPMLVTLPFALLLLDYWPLRRIASDNASRERSARRFGELLLEKTPLLAISALSCAIALAAQWHGGPPAFADRLSLGLRIENASITYLRYIGKTFWPAHLAMLYPHPGSSLPGWQAAIAIAVLLAISASAILTRKRLPYFAVGWFWFLGTLLPVIGIVQTGAQSMADRYMYWPSIGLFIVAVWAAADLGILLERGGRAPKGILTAAVVVIFASVASRQQAYWRDSETLFRHTLLVTGRNPVVRNNLGFLYERQGRLDAAIAEYRQAIADNRDPALPKIDAVAYANLGRVLEAQGNRDAAIAEYRKAIEANPDSADLRHRLGAALADSSRLREALREYREAVRLDPDFGQSHYDLALALIDTGEPDEAAQHFREAARLLPDFPDAHFNLGLALAAQGDFEEAAKCFARVLELNSDDAAARSQLNAMNDKIRGAAIRQ